MPILSTEDLVVLKPLFNRHKDIVDIERIMKTSTKALDHAYIRRWPVECVGADDSRLDAAHGPCAPLRARWRARCPPS